MRWAQADVMEQIHLALPSASITPTWAWEESTGKGVRVAVIDSGVNANHRSLGGRIAGYVSISRGGDGLLYDERPHSDPVGHGTACAGIIRWIAPDCELYSVRVVGPDRLGYCDVLAAGLKPHASANAVNTAAKRWAESVGFSRPVHHHWAVLAPKPQD